MKGRKRRRGQRGTTMVEFAMVFPMFLFVIIGGIDLIMAALSGQTLWTAAREASRSIALGHTVQETTADANAVLELGHVPADQVVWSVEDQGEFIAVRLTYAKPVLVPLLPALLGGSVWDRQLQLSRQVMFRKRG